MKRKDLDFATLSALYIYSPTKYVNNKNSYLLRTVILGCNFFDDFLVAGIRNSGEMVFCMLDLYRLLGILVVSKNEIDLSPLINYGYTEEKIEEIDFNSYYDFKTVVEFCIRESKGLMLLSSLTLYLKSFGLDYFNKWYYKYIKDIKLVDSAPFYLIDMEVPLLFSDFKNEDENLCGVTGDLYVIKFSTSVIKVGKSSSGSARIRQHVNEAGRYLVKVVDSYIKYKARLGEDILLDFCNKNGKLFYGKEYFKDLSFNKVKEFLIDLG